MNAFLYYIKRMHHFAGKGLYVNVVGRAIVSLLEGAGILLLIPLISFGGFVQVENVSGKIMELFYFLTRIPESFYLPLVLGLYLFIVVGQTFLQRYLSIRDARIRENFSRHLRLDIYSSLLNSRWSFFLQKRKSDLVNLLTTELARVLGAINYFLQLLSHIIFTVIQICIALWLSAGLTLFILACGLVIGYYSKSLIKRSNKLGKQTSKLGETYMAGITDQINGIKDIKSNTLEHNHVNWLQSLTEKMSEEQINYVKLRSDSQLIYKLSSACLIALFIFISLKTFSAQQDQVLLLILIFSRLWPKFTSIQSNIEQIAASIPSCRLVRELLQECQKEKEKVAVSIKTENKTAIKGSFQCQNVSFRYNKMKEECVLDNINLHILQNQITAIVGPSGAGKSTLIDLLMGLNIPEKGEVLIDGSPLTEENLLALRNSISYVSQDPFLFNTSIRENLLMVKNTASDEEIWEALQFSQGYEFVKELPHGLDTVIGDRGVRLSGGERQRLVLARALLKKPSILILDEATSALDVRNEEKVSRAVEELKGRMTVIIIAHRLSTIRNADAVIVLEKGKIVQQGSYTQLSKEKGHLFNELLQSQAQAVQ
ncbi:ABC transporter ATP-binding protein [Priestia endophytica]|uniref:ABC transporter ATP-binding protein n=1 Tax=Priestia endophytica TaxID=135735 RepID=UPI003D2943A0